MNATQQPKPEITIPAWVPPIFLDACGDHPRLDIGHPFIAHSWLWATDGKILVRREFSSKELAEAPGHWTSEKRRLPDVLETWNQLWSPDSRPYVAPLPPGNYEPTECPECGGVGAYTAFCDCEECDGEGVIESCFRVPIRERPAVVLLSRYVGLLLKHGVSYVRAGKTMQPVYFEGHGFEGLLMTCTEAKP